MEVRSEKKSEQIALTDQIFLKTGRIVSAITL